MNGCPDTECQGIIEIKANGFLDEGNSGIHIAAGQCKNLGCNHHYVRITRTESNCFLSYLN